MSREMIHLASGLRVLRNEKERERERGGRGYLMENLSAEVRASCLPAADKTDRKRGIVKYSSPNRAGKTQSNETDGIVRDGARSRRPPRNCRRIRADSLGDVGDGSSRICPG